MPENPASPVTHASRMREITCNNGGDKVRADKLLAEVMEKVEKAAKNGEWLVDVAVETPYSEHVIKSLKAAGYTISCAPLRDAHQYLTVGWMPASAD